MRSAKQFLFGSLGVAIGLAGLSAVAATPIAQANPDGTDLVISEVYGGGGTVGSTYTHDFVELYNPTDTAVDLTGWAVLYGSASRANGAAITNKTALSGSIPAHGHYLVQQAGNTANGDPLPTPDATGTINMAGASGLVILSNQSENLTGMPTGSIVNAAGVIDAVGFGTANTFETASQGTALSASTSANRNATGGDTDDNSADFSVAPPNPTNSDDGDTEPAPLAVTNPGNKTFTRDTAIAPITLTATGGTAPYTWAITAGTLPAGLELVDNQITGTPTASTAGAVEITVQATDGADPAETSDATFTITVNEPLAVTPIHEIQGTGARSPFAPATGNGAGTEVKVTEGVVTAAYLTGGFNGLYIQTPGVDTENASDGIFVYGGPTNANIPADVEVGDSVRVTGPIAEFFSLTQIIPASGGVTILEEPLGTVTPRDFTYPTTDAEREQFEGELVAPAGTLTISNVYQTNQYGEIGLASGEGPLKQPSEFADVTDSAALQAVKDENAGRAVILDDGSTTNYLQNQTTKALPVPWLTGADDNVVASPPRVGATVDFQAPVVFDYRNDAWKFQPQEHVTTNGADVATFEDTRAGNLVPQDVGGNVKIATFNVLNYFNTTGDAYADAGQHENPPVDTHCTYYTDRQSNRIGNNRCGVRGPGIPSPNDGRGPRGAATADSLTRQEAKLAQTIVDMGADVIGLEEIENSIKLPGEPNRDDAVANLVDLVNAIEGAGTWKYVKSPAEATTAAAVAEQDTIRSAFIYRAAAVTPVGQSDILFGTDEFTNAREPLAQAFKKAGGRDEDAFAIIVNHFKSKGDNQSPAPPATGDNANNDDTGAFNGDRKRAATRLLEFADDFAAERGVAAIFLAGDFNAYSQEEPVAIIEEGGFARVESDTAGEYSYSFSGLSGSLDHIFANAAALDLVTGADIWEINANEAISFQYSRYNYNVTDLWQPNLPFATSDHNPKVVGLDLSEEPGPSYKEIQVLGTNDFHGRLLPDGGNAAGAGPFATALEELRAENPNSIFVAAGDLIGASTFESFIQDDEPTIDALNAMGLEVSAAGNHEFDKGYDDLSGRVRSRADWEYIAANLEYDDSIAADDQLAETWTTTIDGVDLGFVGAVTEDLPALVNPEGIDGITVTDVVDATNAAAASLKAGGADIVILLVHEGSGSTQCTSPSFTDDATTFGNIVQNTSAEVDAIISGHTHLAYNCKFDVADWVADSDRDVKKRPVVSAGQYGTNLNKLVFKFDETSGDLAVISQEIVAAAGVGHAPDPDVQAIVDDAVEFAETAGNEVLGQMTGPFQRASYLPSGQATENRGGESTLSNLVAEVQRWATDEAGIDTDIAFMNPGGLRADMAGVVNGDLRDLTYRGAADVQPFANTLVNMKLTGAQLKTVLEQQWQRNANGGVPTRPFLRLGVSEGFTYTYVETPETVSVPNAAPVDTFRGEVTGMWLNGEPIDLAATYSVTVNSFLGTGGDNFWELANGGDIVDTGKADLQAMVDYMAQYDADNPLVVDYSQRAVELTLPTDAPASYAPGDTVAFDIASWAMTAAGDLTDSEIVVKHGDEVLGTFAVDNTVGGDPYDNHGTASISFVLPESVPDGNVELTVSGATTGTSVPLVIAVDNETDPEPVDREIQILGTNDFHGRIVQNAGNREAGAAVLSGAVKQLRAENPNTIFAAAGDLIGASTFESFIQQDKPTIDALNEAGLDVSAVGNHELDAGYDDLINRVMAAYDETSNPKGGAAWQYIAANLKIKATGDDAVPATWIKTLDGVDVGFIGAVTEDLPSLVSPSGIADLEVTGIVESVNAEAADLTANGAEIVVLLVHEGAATTSCASPQFTDPSTTWGNITQNTSADVDAIISGHTHLAYDCAFPVAEWEAENRAVTDRPVVSAGQYGMNLNQLKFTVDETGAVAGLETAILPLMGPDPDGSGPELPPALYPADPAVSSIVTDAVAEAEVLGAVKLGQIQGPFNRAKLSNGTTENRGGESTLGNKVAEVQRWATQNPESGSAQIAFMNPGGLRADMVGTVNGDARDLTYKQAAVVQPFANTLVNMDLTGEQIKTVLEQQWQRDGSGNVPTRPFLRLGVSDGFTYTYVEKPVTVGTTNTFAGEITGMWLDGEPIDLATTYSVTVNSFLASGGDNFFAFAEGSNVADTGKADLAAMVDYMAEFAADEPLPVDYSQRAVEVEFPADAPAAYAPGATVAFDISSWTMSTADDVKDDEVEVWLDDELLGAFETDNTIGDDVFDQYGTAAVSVALPDGLVDGTVTLTLKGAATGTEFPVVIGIDTRVAPTVKVTNARQVYGKPVTVNVAVDAGDVPTEGGEVVLKLGAKQLGTGTVGADGTVGVQVAGLAQRPADAPYTITAEYAGVDGVAPATGSGKLTVRKGVVDVRVAGVTSVIRAKKTQATVRIRVTNPDGVPVRGTVTVSASGVGSVKGTVVNGTVVVRLKAFPAPGAKTLVVRYNGSGLVPAKRITSTIRVTR